MLTLAQGQAAIDWLAQQGAVPNVVYFNSARVNCDILRDEEYRRRFSRYYRLRLNRDAFFRVFYDVCAGRISRDLGAIITRLRERTGRNHLSFASKLLATLDDQWVVYDSLVAGYFGISSQQAGLNVRLGRHAQLQAGLSEFTQRAAWPEIRNCFDQSFAGCPGAATLSDLRKADLVIWAHMHLQPESLYDWLAAP